MTTDHELLQLAAKAAGHTLGPEWDCCDPKFGIFINGDGCCSGETWDPLLDDGDALRLAVNLELDIRQIGGTTAIFYHQTHLASEHLGDALERTRRAIVRAAAEIGGAK